MKLATIGFFALSLLAAAPAARADRVDHLGRTSVSNRGDFDRVPIHSCGYGNEKVSALKLRIRADATRIDYLEVTYGNGERDQLHVRQYFPRGGETRWIDLRGAYRCVKSVLIIGQSRPDWSGRPSVIDIYGLVKRVR